MNFELVQLRKNDVNYFKKSMQENTMPLLFAAAL